MMKISIFFKDLLVNNLAQKLTPKFYIRLMLIYGWIFRILGNKEALKNVEQIENAPGCYRLSFWNKENWLMINPIRINRYLKGIDYAGMRIYERYKLQDTMKVQITEKYFVDVGANVGELSYYFARRDFSVFCFEPDPIVSSLLIENMKKFQNVKVSTDALGNKKGRLTLYLKSDSADTSLVDSGHHTSTSQTRVIRFDEHEFSSITTASAILKVDAEGFEPEVIAGFGGVVNKFAVIAVDCGMERNGKSTAFEVKKILNKFQRFEVHQYNDLMLLATFEA